MDSRPDRPGLNSVRNELFQRQWGTLLAGAWLLATAVVSAEPKTQARATFAGGCFWSVEAAFDKVKGVQSTTSGFAGGKEPNPTYEQVASGRTGHAEVVQVVFDPAKVTYAKLLEAFWKNVDPFDAGGQFCDRGRSYRTAIFYEGEEQKQAAQASKESLERQGRLPAPIATEIAPLEAFYPAEAAHQDFYLRNVRQYWSYRSGCGRDARLKQLWGQ
jgi:peptide-methionine (S)-S-oxide reductase